MLCNENEERKKNKEKLMKIGKYWWLCVQQYDRTMYDVCGLGEPLGENRKKNRNVTLKLFIYVLDWRNEISAENSLK